MDPLRVLTVDLEEWFHLLDHPATAGEERWSSFETRLARNTERLLELFERRRVRATFFALGWVARTHPEVLRSVVRAGHEIGSHSDVHTLAHAQTPAAFREETQRSLRVLEDATGAPVRYYRAPGFSITPDNAWAFEVLAELGIGCDLSLFPGAHAHGGFSHLPSRGPLVLERGGATLRELPMTLAGRGRLRLAYSGGGYFRLLPYSLIATLCAREDYLMTYFHPRDFDPGQPVVPGLSTARRFRAYVGLGSSLAKLDRLLTEFRFVDVRGAEEAIDWSRVPHVTV